jgi:hypothetical protein
MLLAYLVCAPLAWVSAAFVIATGNGPSDPRKVRSTLYVIGRGAEGSAEYCEP